MAILSDLLPASAQRTLLRRFLDDLGICTAGCVWAAVLITMALGRPQYLFTELVYCICIGVIALVLMEFVRLRGWDGTCIRSDWVKRGALLALVISPIAHTAGVAIGNLVLGRPWPSRANYPVGQQVMENVFTLLAFYGVGFVLWNRDRVERIRADGLAAEARAEAVERRALEAQLRLLQAQIEPHMLFNTLANLKGLIAIDPAQANRMLDQLIRYLRATLSATRAERTTLGEEFAAGEAYLGLMQVRMGARLAYRCTLPDDLRRVPVPTMLLQPLIENAVLHGLDPKIDGGEVHVSAAVRDGCLELSVRDTGLGLDDMGSDDTPEPKGGGVGLATTRERLRALYGARGALTLQPAAPQGALALLTLPLASA